MYIDEDAILEELLDSLTLSVLLERIDSICFEKAEHLRSNWQDEPTAQAWEHAGSVVGGIAHTTVVIAVS